MHVFKRPAYAPIPTEEEGYDASQNKEASFPSRSTLTVFRFPKIRWIHVAIGSYLLTVACLCWSMAVILRLSSLQHSLETVSIFSPALQAIEYVDMDLPNEFDSGNIYRGPPTPQREAAWLKLWNQKQIVVPTNEMARLNRSVNVLDDFVKAPETAGSGYVGGLEVFHQLHCLNYIRQFTWYTMNKYDNETMPADFRSAPLRNLRMHADHCIETLRLTLMCHSDVTPVMLKWDSYYNPPRASPDFNTHHRCRDFERIVEWNVLNGLETFGEGGHHH